MLLSFKTKASSFATYVKIYYHSCICTAPSCGKVWPRLIPYNRQGYTLQYYFIGLATLHSRCLFVLCAYAYFIQSVNEVPGKINASRNLSFLVVVTCSFTKEFFAFEEIRQTKAWNKSILQVRIYKDQ